MASSTSASSGNRAWPPRAAIAAAAVAFTALGLQVSPTLAAGSDPTTTSVGCSPSTILAGGQTTCTATVTNTSNTTNLLPNGTVLFTATPSNLGIFQSAGTQVCTLPSSTSTASSGQQSCDIAFVGNSPGSVKIVANYQGDFTHAASSNFADITIASQAPSPSPKPAAERTTDSGLTIAILQVPYRQLPTLACTSLAGACADIMQVDVYLGFGYSGSGTVNVTDAPGPGLAIDNQWQLVDTETGSIYPIHSEGDITGACAGGDQSSLSNVYVIVQFPCFGRTVESGHCYVPRNPVVWFIQEADPRAPLKLRYTDFNGKSYDIELGTMNGTSDPANVGVGGCTPPSATSGSTGTYSPGGSSSPSGNSGQSQPNVVNCVGDIFSSIGGGLFSIGAGIFGIATSETGIGAVLGWAGVGFGGTAVAFGIHGIASGDCA